MSIIEYLGVLIVLFLIADAVMFLYPFLIKIYEKRINANRIKNNMPSIEYDKKTLKKTNIIFILCAVLSFFFVIVDSDSSSFKEALFYGLSMYTGILSATYIIIFFFSKSKRIKNEIIFNDPLYDKIKKE